MKRFLKRITIFSLLFIFLIAGLMAIIFWYVNRRANLIVDKNIKYVIFGHSHPACAFNDSLINNVKNYSASGESLFYTYTKIEHILAQNTNIDTIFIEFSNRHIAKNGDENIAGDIHLQTTFANFAPLQNIPDHKFLFKSNKSGYIQSLPITIKTQFRKIVLNDFNFLKLGGFQNLQRNKTDSLLRYGDKEEEVLFSKEAYSPETIAILKRIIDYCKLKNKKVFLVRSPQHAKYAGRMNEESFQAIRMKNFPDIEYLDFNDFPLENSEFGDLNHLNFKGARKFSIWFNEQIGKGFLRASNKQQFISDAFGATK